MDTGDYASARETSGEAALVFVCRPRGIEEFVE
jgi:hypothetical protein